MRPRLHAALAKLQEAWPEPITSCADVMAMDDLLVGYLIDTLDADELLRPGRGTPRPRPAPARPAVGS